MRDTFLLPSAIVTIGDSPRRRWTRTPVAVLAAIVVAVSIGAVLREWIATWVSMPPP
jgi:hypothetical protein